MRFPWVEVRVAVAALARDATLDLARRNASLSMNVSSASNPDAALDEALRYAEGLASEIVEALTSFPEAPFTVQRLVELLLEPDSYCATPEKLARAAGKLLVVTSMVATAAPVESYAQHVTTEEMKHASDPLRVEQNTFFKSMVGEATEPARPLELEEKGIESTSEQVTEYPGTVVVVPVLSPEVLSHAEVSVAENRDIDGVEQVKLAIPLHDTEDGKRGEKRGHDAIDGEVFVDEIENRLVESALPGKPAEVNAGVELLTAGA